MWRSAARSVSRLASRMAPCFRAQGLVLCSIGAAVHDGALVFASAKESAASTPLAAGKHTVASSAVVSHHNALTTGDVVVVDVTKQVGHAQPLAGLEGAVVLDVELVIREHAACKAVRGFGALKVSHAGHSLPPCNLAHVLLVLIWVGTAVVFVLDPRLGFFGAVEVKPLGASIIVVPCRSL